MTSASRQAPYRLVLDRDRGSIRRARQFVDDRCSSAGLEPDMSRTAVLLTSEVVTNALLHARSEARLGVLCGRSTVRVEVGDDSPDHPRLVTAAADAPSGRGLWLVDLLAGAWGVVDDSAGKVVWFELSPAT